MMPMPMKGRMPQAKMPPMPEKDMGVTMHGVTQPEPAGRPMMKGRMAAMRAKRMPA